MGCGQSSTKSERAVLQPSVDVSKLATPLEPNPSQSLEPTLPPVFRRKESSVMNNSFTVNGASPKPTPLPTPKIERENNPDDQNRKLSTGRRHPGVRAVIENDTDRASYSAPVQRSSRGSPKTTNRVLPINMKADSPKRPKSPQLSEF